MAEEEIIILEESEEESSTPKKEEIKKEKKPALDKKKKIIIIGGAIFALLLAIIIIVIISISGSKEPTVMDVNTTVIAEKLNKKNDFGQFSPSHLENMIKKANLLYERGNKQEALKVYKRISTFNEAISYYNIGVAKMKEKDFKEAINSFKKAIENGEQRCVSSINAAVCALELNNKGLFKYYIDLAFTYLPMESNAPLYSYYVGLINYYRDYYYESLAALTNASSEYYNYKQNYVASKILASIDLNNKAVNILEKKSKIDDYLTLGLLYAKLGEFQVAQNYLIKARGDTQKPLHVKAALILVDNKLGELENSAMLMDELYKQADENATKIYPIKTILKKSLFDINIAQDEFDKTLFFDDARTYSLLFYFAPFKVFNAKQTIDYIRKGSINIFIDEIGPALSYLKKSSTISKVNISISNGIKKALNHHTEQANKIFLKMIDTYPKHSILHYNLALTYAQMSDFSKAYEHFAKSYHLNNNNYLAGAFAIMTGELIKKDIKKLKEDVKQSMTNDHKLKESNLFMSLIHLSENNQLSLTRWLENDKEKTPLNLIFDTIIAQKIFNEKAYRQKATILKSILPKDIMANIINFNVKYKKNDIKKYAKAIQINFKKLDLDYDSFYYGPRIVQESYIKLLQIGGLLYHERNRLIKKMELEKNDIAAIMQTVAYLSIYTHNFEEAYVLYNKLIDDLKKNDSATIFYAAVASIGANHTENAVALLELAKLTDPKNYESRYALGLLYQEIGNWDGATIQYRKIGNSDFQSKYFSFKVTK
jgi:tetratricopeptide (TPR) repeat protein